VHRAAGTSYSPILQARASKNPIFLKTQNKHLYWLYSSEILDIKALEYNKYFTHVDKSPTSHVPHNSQITTPLSCPNKLYFVPS
jgi:hypothetical protein